MACSLPALRLLRTTTAKPASLAGASWSRAEFGAAAALAWYATSRRPACAQQLTPHEPLAATAPTQHLVTYEVEGSPGWVGEARRRLIAILRGCYLILALLPLILAYPLSRYSITSEFWWRWCVHVSEESGALLIKLAQWASSRPDLFSEAVCERFRHLQDDTPPHAWPHTAQALDDMFGERWRSELRVEQTPIGSGCIAQVYRGEMRQPDGSWQPVAIKVLHPSVATYIHADMELLRAVAGLLHSLPRLRWLNPSGMVDEFAGMLTSQLDLRVEAANLVRFVHNFHVDGEEPVVVFPQPIPGYVSPKVLVETFIDGEPLMVWAQRYPEGAPEREEMMNTGIDAFCKMLFTDNFFHGDLHPGNIFVTRAGKLAFLDAGIAVEYTDRDHEILIDILSCFLKYDGYAGGLKMLEQTASQSDVSDPHGFCTKIHEMVIMARDNPTFFDQIGHCISLICEAACDHHVLIAQGFISVALSVKVVEGAVIQIAPSAVVAPRAKALIVREHVKRKGRNVLGRRLSSGELEDYSQRTFEKFAAEARLAAEKHASDGHQSMQPPKR